MTDCPVCAGSGLIERRGLSARCGLCDGGTLLADVRGGTCDCSRCALGWPRGGMHLATPEMLSFIEAHS